MALVAGGIGQTQILVFQRAAPFAIQDFLQFSDVQNSGYALTDGTDYLAVLYGFGDCPVYGLRNISATSPSGGNIGVLP